jgi:hypothetical protein
MTRRMPPRGTLTCFVLDDVDMLYIIVLENYNKPFFTKSAAVIINRVSKIFRGTLST